MTEPSTTPSNQPHLLIISHDVIGARMAGPGIRYWELAHVIAAHQPVTLIAPQPIDRASPTVETGNYAWGDAESLARWVQDADVVLANGFVLPAHPELTAMTQPLAIDLYDPTLLENLELVRTEPPERRSVQSQHDIAALKAQLTAGDFFLCATERQRDLYLGALMAVGRITPDAVEHDPLLRNLIDILPFGLPAEPPVKRAPALRSVVPGISADDRLILWTGGLWDWMDPLTLIRALPHIVAQHPDVRLVFLSGQHPGSIHPMHAPNEARALAESFGLIDKHIFFYDDWIPYAQRADFLLEADIAVSLHRNHLETAYAAIRSRFLDHLWTGLPSVVSDGDAASSLVREYRLGQVVPSGDVERTAEALDALLRDPDKRHACAARARELAARYIWERVAEPLIAFSLQPRTTRPQTIASTASPTPTPPATPLTPTPAAPTLDDFIRETQQTTQAYDASRNAILQTLEPQRQIHEPSLPGGIIGRLRNLLIRQLVRPFVAPLIERQNAYNAAVTRGLNALAENSDIRRAETYTLVNSLSGYLAAQAALIGPIHTRLDDIERRLAHLDEQLRDAYDADTSLAERIADMAASAERKEDV